MTGKITAIRFKNYKRLRNFTLRARQGNILVSPNNSGKSSILDAFRLLEAGIRYSRRKRPSLMNTSEGFFDGYEIPESACPFHLTNVVTDYDDNEATIEFDHENGSTAHLCLSNNRTVRFFIDAGGRRFGTSRQFRKAFLTTRTSGSSRDDGLSLLSVSGDQKLPVGIPPPKKTLVATTANGRKVRVADAPSLHRTNKILPSLIVEKPRRLSRLVCSADRIPVSSQWFAAVPCDTTPTLRI